MSKNKYFIGCRLDEGGSARAKRIAGYLQTTFGIRNVFEKYDPHITWKAPFYATESELAELYKVLEKFAEGRTTITAELVGFGHFGNGVVYADIICHHDEIVILQKELCQALELLEWITFERNEPSGIPHVTVGLDDVRGRFPFIYENLQQEFKGGVRMRIQGFDVFAKNTHGSWITVKNFPFMTSEKSK